MEILFLSFDFKEKIFEQDLKIKTFEQDLTDLKINRIKSQNQSMIFRLAFDNRLKMNKRNQEP
jgi:hypothetical protein